MKYCLVLDSTSFLFNNKIKKLSHCLWRLSPFINDFIDAGESVAGQNLLSSTGLKCRDVNFKGYWL